jgi:hypothetical protein
MDTVRDKVGFPEPVRSLGLSPARSDDQPIVKGYLSFTDRQPLLRFSGGAPVEG